MNPSVRPLDPARDLEAVSALCDELGYPTPIHTLKTRLKAIAAQGSGHGLFVAQDQGQVVGWVHIYGVCLLESPGYAELGGLVVRSALNSNLGHQTYKSKCTTAAPYARMPPGHFGYEDAHFKSNQKLNERPNHKQVYKPLHTPHLEIQWTAAFFKHALEASSRPH